MIQVAVVVCDFLFGATATTNVYTLSLHDALPILLAPVSLAKRPQLYGERLLAAPVAGRRAACAALAAARDRKSTRLNSSHLGISYAVFCLKKKNRSGLSLGSALARSAVALHNGRI